MHEVRRTVARLHGRREPGGRQHLGFEVEHRLDLFAWLQTVPRKVQKSGSQVFDRAEALPELLRLLDLLDQAFRQRFARCDVAGVVRQNIRVEHPHFVQLRRELDIVPGDRGACPAGVGGIGKQSVPHVAELVEERVDVVQAQQCRFAGCRAGHVHRHGDDGLFTRQAGAGHEFRHPRPTALAGARVRVDADQAQDFGALGDLPHRDGFVPQAACETVGDVFKAQSVQHARGIENTVVQHPVELEVLADFAVVDAVQLRTYAAQPERDVFRGKPLRLRGLFDGVEFTLQLLIGRFQQRNEQTRSLFRVAGLLRFNRVLAERAVAQHTGQSGAQRRDVCNQTSGVTLTAATAPISGCRKQRRAGLRIGE